LKPTLPKGTRDFLPQEVKKRNYIFTIIKKYFALYGFDPIETPAMESLDTLTGKYGDEGDKLLFKILNNGNYLAEVPSELLAERESKGALPFLSKRGLRYDLTVPFARYIVMNRQHIKLPFKRSAIQPVWRADRPQKGRYQEFYQCDADVAGSDSLISEIEFVQIYDQVFSELNLPVIIRINHRKLLQGIVESAGMGDRFEEVVTFIDKLDKIEAERIKKDMLDKGFHIDSVTNLFEILENKNIEDLPVSKLNEKAMTGLKETQYVITLSQKFGLKNQLKFDATLARGLSYYTGCIFEVTAVDANMGSIGGGGRYNDLTAAFGMPDIPGVGISFGAERIYDLMEEKKLFPIEISSGGRLIILFMDESVSEYAFNIAYQLRKAGIACEIYPVAAKINKLMSYANERNFQYAALVGLDEMNASKVTLKNMSTGVQQSVLFSEIGYHI